MSDWKACLSVSVLINPKGVLSGWGQDCAGHLSSSTQTSLGMLMHSEFLSLELPDLPRLVHQIARWRSAICHSRERLHCSRFQWQRALHQWSPTFFAARTGFMYNIIWRTWGVQSLTCTLQQLSTHRAHSCSSATLSANLDWTVVHLPLLLSHHNSFLLCKEALRRRLFYTHFS